MNRNTFMALMAVLLAVLPWIMERFSSFAQVVYSYQCKSNYSIRYSSYDDRRSVVSDGSMQFSYFSNGLGVGTYTGRLERLSAEGQLVNSWAVHRTFEFTYSVVNGMLKTTTINSTKNQGNELGDEDANKYVYSGFEVGYTSFSVLMKINSSSFTSGSTIYPNALCSPIK